MGGLNLRIMHVETVSIVGKRNGITSLGASSIEDGYSNFGS